jgi:glutamine synthetase
MAAYTRIRALFADHLGLARGKWVPREHADKGTRFCVSLFGLGFDRTLIPVPGAMMLDGLPDCELTFPMEAVRAGWEADTGVVVGDLSFRGQPLAIAPRHVLGRAVADWQRLGYEVRVGLELEAFVLQADGGGGWTEWDTPSAYVYGTGSAVDPAGLMDEIMTAAERSGLPLEAIHSEYDPPQFELALAHDQALASIDNAFLAKVMARELAARRGLLLTFLGKPFADRAGSGLHINLSLWNAQGENALADPRAPDGLSEVAHRCIAGMLHHHEGLAALCASTVNAYKRLRPGQLAGYWANWGYDHRGVTVRVPPARGAGTHLEHRLSDGAANCYLATAAVLQAARLGVTGKLTPPPAEEQDCFTQQSTERHAPEDLARALDALEADTTLIEAVGAEVVAALLPVKRAEWAKFAAAVTDWERRYYLPFL